MVRGRTNTIHQVVTEEALNRKFNMADHKVTKNKMDIFFSDQINTNDND